MATNTNKMTEESNESSSSNDEDWEDEDVDDPVECLFCDDVIDSAALAISHCKLVHQFDFRSIMKKFNMDCYSFIKLINFIRRTKPSPLDIMHLEAPSWNDDTYLKPVLEFDPWLMFDFENYLASVEEQNGEENHSTSNGDQVLHFQTMLRQKDDQIAELVDQSEQMRTFVHKLLGEEDGDDDAANTNGSRNHARSDRSYFESYSHPGIHFDMLSDEVRTSSYRDAIMLNEPVFSGKTVLDLGCGTGILSMFAVSTGAEKVLAIDNSDIVTYTLDIVRENKMEDKIDVIKSRIEDTILPIQQVDVIISEWMGYFLLFEGMLDSLIYARDRYLKKDGVLVPDKCDLFVCGANDPEGLKNSSTFWSNVYGYRMTCIQKETMKQAVVDFIGAEKIVTSCARIVSFNLYSCTVADTVFESPFAIKATEDTTVTTIVGYFDVHFILEHVVHFSTSPSSPPTHWKQTLFHIHKPVSLKKGETLDGILRCERNSKNSRSLQITIIVRDESYVYDLD